MTTPRAQARSTENDGVPAIASVLAQVQEGLVKAQTQISDLAMPRLEKVTVTLQTEVLREGGGKIKVLISSFGVQEARKAEPPLQFRGLTAEFSYGVTAGTSGELEFEIVPGSGELKGELTKKALHKILVSFQAPD